MRACQLTCRTGAILLSILMAKTASAQLEPSCVADSPERRGEIGCSLVENKPTRGAQGTPVLAHRSLRFRGERPRSGWSSERRIRGSWDMVADDDRIRDRRSSWWSTCDTRGASGSAARAEVFDVGDVSVHSGWTHFTHSYAFGRRGFLCCRWAAVPGDTDTSLQNAERRKPCHSYRRDDAVGSYGYKTSPRVSCYRLRLVSAANNANRDGTSAEARFVQVVYIDDG